MSDHPKKNSKKTHANRPEDRTLLRHNDPNNNQSDHDQGHSKDEYRQRLQRFYEFFNSYSFRKFWQDPKTWFEIAALVVVIAYTNYARRQVAETMESNQLAVQSLRVSQRAYVTIGRKDGVLADFVVPRDASQNAELIIYFQNSGRLPAKFIWGTLFEMEGVEGKSETHLKYTHPFVSVLQPRTRDKKNGGWQETGESTIIAGDSILATTAGTIPQADLKELPINRPNFMIHIIFDYCDEIGTRSSRTIFLRYRASAPNTSMGFDLASEAPWPRLRPPRDTDTIEYLSPCETASDYRERTQEKRR